MQSKPQKSSALADLAERLLQAGAGRPDLAIALERLGALILEAGRTMNLTADTDPQRFAARHLEDALAAAVALHEALGWPAAPSIADVGSGGGIPGLVWALAWPRAQIVLIESRRKKADFLERAAAALGLRNVRVLGERAETAAQGPPWRDAFDLAAGRALAPLPTAVEWLLPLVRPGGRAVVLAALSARERMREAERVAQRIGGGAAGEWTYSLSDGRTCLILWFQKAMPTPPEFPRAPGRARKRPPG